MQEAQAKSEGVKRPPLGGTPSNSQDNVQNDENSEQKTAEKEIQKPTPQETTEEVKKPSGLATPPPAPDYNKVKEDAGFKSGVTNSLAKSGLNADVLDYNSSNSLDDMLEGAKILIESGILPNLYTEPAQVIGAVKMGHEYGFSSTIALNNIHMIEGKPTLSVHMIGALLIRGGWRFSVENHPCQENNFTAVIRFTNFKALDALNKEYINAEKLSDQVKRRILATLEMKEKAISQVFTFSYSEAQTMGLTNKSNWKKMPIIMLRNRCITLGARAVAPDLLMGMMETSEWADVENVTLDLDEEGNVRTAD